jgi:transcriptional regulator with XRE-family HTH domain
MEKGNSKEGATLGDYLKAIRGANQSLRDVEEATGVSNAYLSQLEQGKMTNPSPHILHKLAAFYEVPYETLMEKAGYITRSEDEGAAKRRSGKLAALSVGNLTRQEEEKLLDYLAFLRSRK